MSKMRTLLSKRAKSIINLLQGFAISGDEFILQKIPYRIDKAIPIQPELAFTVASKCADLIEFTSNDDHIENALLTLMHIKENSYYKEFLLLLQNSPLITRFLQLITNKINKADNPLSCTPYLRFIREFVMDSYERQNIILSEEGQHTLQAVAKVFHAVNKSSSDPNKFTLTQCAILLAHLGYIHHEADDQRGLLWFLNIDGFSLISSFFLTVIDYKRKSDLRNDFLHEGITIIFLALQYLNITGLDRDLYCIDRNSAYRMNVAFYKLFSEELIHIQHLYWKPFFLYMEYLQAHDLDAIAQSLLLYKPPGKDVNSCFALQLLHLSRNSNSKNSVSIEAEVLNTLGDWVERIPEVAALLDEPLRELPPDRDDKVRVCAYPGCNIDGKGLFCKMLKCGRCRNVYYCHEDHQKQHWKEHKQTCESTAAAVTTSLLDEPLRELPPDRDDKVRVCALLGCGVNGEGLLRCSRCCSVHYCGVEHQKQHWKVHKQLCSELPNTDAVST